MEEAYQCPNCGLPLPNDVICQQCGYRFARSGAGIRTSKLKLCVIAVAILTVLGLGMFLVGVPSEIRAVMRPVTVALVEIIDLLRGNDLGQFNHSGFSECVGCNLSGVDLSGADLSGANLRFANLTDADLTRANLFGARLTGVDLNDANLTTANLTDAWLSGANLAAVNLSMVYLSGFNLSGKNLSEANLTDAWLVRADLTNANLTAAILVEADLTRANLDDVVGADFRGALNVPDKYLKDAGGKVDDVGKDVVSLLQQDNPKFCAECDLANADLTWADLSKVDMTGADLTRANLHMADLSEAGLDGVIGADFSGAKNAFP